MRSRALGKGFDRMGHSFQHVSEAKGLVVLVS
jgi:hypothetical protein